MTDNVAECKEKFQKVLQCIKSQSKLQDDTFLEKIQSYLLADEYVDLAKEPETIAWIERIVNDFDGDSIPTQQVANFTLKLVCLLCTNEWNFVAVKERGILDKIQRGIQTKAELQTPSTKLNHLKILRAISQHSIGLHWLKQIKCWILIIDYYQSNPTIYITREAAHFFYEIFTKFSELMKDEQTTLEALEMLMEPIMNYKGLNANLVGQVPIIVDNDEMANKFVPIINIINQILWLCIESRKRSRIAYFILLKNRFENKLWIIQESVHNDVTFLTAICRAHIISNFARLSSMDIPPTDVKAKDLSFDEHAVHFYNLAIFCCMRRIYKCINMIMECHHQLWSMLSDEVTKEVVLENHDLKFGDQVIMIQTFPIVHAINSQYKTSAVYINDLCTKMFHMSCEHTVKILYNLRDLLVHENFEFVANLASSAVHSIIAVKKFIKRDRAILAFQILIHVLKSYIDEPSGLEISNISTQLVLQSPNLLSAILNALNEMISYFKLSWKECIESTAIVPLLLCLLENPNVSPKQNVESLKLIQTSIEHFLAPNLALLTDKVEGSGMENLGPTIYKHLHSLSWEVRDSVLELLHSIVEISNEKFPPFQKHILQNKICQTVEIVARNDSEPYVRASALKVLASMIKIRLFWEHSLHELDVKKYAVEVIGTESEGVVRREAVACITAIYNYQQIPQHCFDIIFSVLSHCAVNDFYWEVKVNALEFWKCVICRQFVHQGMIDGTFPAVTFSKEHKKIITLNDKEIQLRLRKVLNELSLRGCLGILVSCLDDSDLEVIRKVVSIVEKIVGYLNKYNYIEEYKMSKAGVASTSTAKPVIDSNYADFKSLHGSRDSEVRNTADISKTTEVIMTLEDGHVNSILDSIRDTDDITLLANTYSSNLHLDSKPCESGLIDENLFKTFAGFTADDFLDYVCSTDLNKIVQEKSEWIHHTETFATLLEDVLRSFKENDDDIELDCY